MSDNQRKQVNEQKTNSKDHPRNKKKKREGKSKTTAMQNHDRERQEEEEEEAAELWRLQETIATHKNNREEGEESQTAITRQHEVLSNTLQGGNSGRDERNQRRKGTEDTQTEQTAAHSPLMLRGCNSHTHRQPRFSRKQKRKHIAALFGSGGFSRQCQQNGT